MVAVVLAGGDNALAMDPRGRAGLYAAATCAAFAALVAGVALLAESAARSGDRLRGRLPPALVGAALLVAGAALVLGPRSARIGGLPLTGLETAMGAWPGWIGVAATLVLLVQGGVRSSRAIVVALAPLSGVVASAVTYGALAGEALVGVQILMSALVVTAFFAIIAIAVLLAWLAAEGLRLSRDVGLWLTTRTESPLRLLARLLAAKAVLIGVLAALVGARLLPDELTPPKPTPGAFLVATPLMLAAVLSLTREHVLRLTPAHFALAGKGFALLLLAVLTPVALYGPVSVAAIAARRPAVLLGAAVLALLALALRTRWCSPRRSRLIAATLLAAGLAAALPLLRGAGAPWIDLPHERQVALPDATPLPLLLALFLVLGLAGAAYVLTRPAYRRLIAFLLALMAWVAATVVLPLLAGVDAEAVPVAFDLALTAAIALTALAWREGLQSAIRPEELVLLLVVCTAVIDVPVLADTLPAGWESALLVAGFLTPALAQLTLDAGPLNVPGPQRTSRVLSTIAVLCLCYGSITALALAAAGSVAVVRAVVDFASGLMAVPFAVLLVVVTSAASRPPPGAPAPRARAGGAAASARPRPGRASGPRRRPS